MHCNEFCQYVCSIPGRTSESGGESYVHPIIERVGLGNFVIWVASCAVQSAADEECDSVVRIEGAVVVIG